tara:strand:- start:5025 stop:5711 length:687 start_codon:yes stop_codon:yes gene_type:complete
MTNDEKLSALFDGELDTNEIDKVLGDLKNDKEMQQKISMYSIINSAINNSFVEDQKVSTINNISKKVQKSNSFWLSNGLTAAASVLITLVIVNFSDISRMNINSDAQNKIYSAINSQEAKEVIERTQSNLVDHVMNVINNPSFMESSNQPDLRNAGYNLKNNSLYSKGNENFQIRVEAGNFGLKKARYWKHGNKNIYVIPMSDGTTVTLYGNISRSTAISIANSLKNN